MDCTNCRIANGPGAAFCSRCGASLAPPPSFCSKCGTSLAAAAGFCKGCGRDLAIPYVPPLPSPMQMQMQMLHMPMPMPMPMALMPLGGCPRCGAMYSEGYSAGIIVCAVLFFPLGLLFLLARKEKRCLNGHCRLVF